MEETAIWARRPGQAEALDTRAGGLTEAGDVVQAVAEGAITPAHIAADLAELCRRTHPGRTQAAQIMPAAAWFDS